MAQFNENVTIIRTNEGIPLEIIGESPKHGGTIIYCKHYDDDGTACPEFTGFRARGSFANPTDAQPGDELLKIAAVGQSGGVGQQGGYIQFRASGGWGGGTPNDAPTNLEFALSPNDSDVPMLRMLLTADGTIEIFGDLEIPNNTMFWAKTTSGGRLGLMYLSPFNETTFQLNNNNLVLSDADTETDQAGKIVGIKATVNGKDGYIPFVEN